MAEAKIDTHAKTAWRKGLKFPIQIKGPAHNSDDAGGTHELTRSGNNRQRIDQMLRTWEFFDRWVK